MTVPRVGRAIGLTALVVLGAGHGTVVAQVPAEPVLAGTAYVGDSVMTEGTVVLHRLSEDTQGELDSLAVGPDGGFAFPLPNVPDPARSDVFFASVRHQGVLYFGPAITTAVELDSIYEIHAYDTLLAPSDGFSVPLQARSVFFEPDSVGWRVTDLFQLRNDEPRTIVAREGGRVWSYPLPSEASEVMAGEGELAFDAARFEAGRLVVRAAIPPGERLFVVRYRVESPALTLPLAGTAEALDVLVREPAPPLEVEGLELLDRIELDPGSTFLRYSGVDVTRPSIRISEADRSGSPRVEWAAVALALVLTGAGLLVLRTTSRPRAVTVGPIVSRSSLIREVAMLDESFERGGASEEERAAYEQKRAALIERIRALD